jgi:hypothetical protein
VPSRSPLARNRRDRAISPALKIPNNHRDRNRP